MSLICVHGCVDVNANWVTFFVGSIRVMLVEDLIFGNWIRDICHC